MGYTTDEQLREAHPMLAKAVDTMRLRTELIQVAAVAVAIVQDLDRGSAAIDGLGTLLNAAVDALAQERT